MQDSNKVGGLTLTRALYTTINKQCAMDERTVRKDYVSVSTAALNLTSLADMVSDPCAGATSTFSGTTRDNHNGER